MTWFDTYVTEITFSSAGNLIWVYVSCA